jgi:predicted short-subunit dehydrogenase-like oxidoreductase (DUF2520 family)
VFLAVPDDALAGLAVDLALAGSRIGGAVAFVHLSGALPLAVLEPLQALHAIGSFHPLQSFPRPRPPSSLHGITIAVDATTSGLERRLADLARSAGAHPKHVGDASRVLYHAAAVFASNFTDALLSVAVDLLVGAGWTRKEAVGGLLPLAEGALDNARKAGPVKALTGPIRRGDVRTVEGHLWALGELQDRRRGASEPQLTDLYRMLGLLTLGIAKEAGLGPAAAERMHRALTREVAATRRRRRA